MKEPITRDRLELALWRVTGAKKAEEIDRLLNMIDAYAEENRTSDLAASVKNSVEKSMLFCGEDPNLLKKACFFPQEKRRVPSFSTGTPQDPAGEDPDFLGMLQEVVDEGRGKDAGKKTQVCSNCRKRKSVDKFSKDRTKVSGYRSHCKACVVERYRARRM